MDDRTNLIIGVFSLLSGFGILIELLRNKGRERRF